MPLSRRGFLSGAAVTAAFAGLARRSSAQDVVSYVNEVPGYGPLVPDPNRIFDLPEGFSYQVVSQAGETMSDGFLVPQKCDGMGCFDLGGGRVALVRNHELGPADINLGAYGMKRRLAGRLPAGAAYDTAGGLPLPGGTTTLVYDTRAQRLERQHLSLAGTAVNCAGGVTPWGSWLSCEESTAAPPLLGVGKSHGWVFEVPARATGPVAPEPLTAMGRFQHEAACVDPRTGIIYMTEDAFDHLGLFYRFLPNQRGRPAAGGRLQALGFRDAPAGGDSRNRESVVWREGDWKDAVWIDMEGVDNPGDDLRLRGHKAGAAVFSRGEGVFWGRGELYFTCTSGGVARMGQVMRYVPSAAEGQPGERDRPGRIQLFVECNNPAALAFPDNIAVSPWGHLMACEDKYVEGAINHLKGITPDGQVYTLGRNAFTGSAEVAGVCFAPDGSTMFLNIYLPGITLAITGPWKDLRT